MSDIIVIGSANIDHLISVPRLPLPGETLHGTGARTAFGGKGANQAVAAARLGGNVAFAGCVGDDVYGSHIIEHLQSEGIGVALVQTAPQTPTGCAYICIAPDGQNNIIVVPGANAAVTPGLIRAAGPEIAQAAIVALQLEIPLAAVKTAITHAGQSGAKVILNCSPVPDDLSIINSQIDYLIINEVEAAQIAGVDFELNDADALFAAAARILARGVKHVVITTGPGPAIYSDDRQSLAIPPPRVAAIDTVGAGDCFTGAFAVAIQQHMPPAEAITFANAAAALSTQTSGAQAGMPRREEVYQFMRTLAPKEAHHG